MTSSGSDSNRYPQNYGLWCDATASFQWETPLPLFRRVRQDFPRPQVADIPAAVAQAMDATGGPFRLSGGKRVAITAGSRGVARIPEILAAVVQRVRHYGSYPFLVPAMGSHGRATAEGQRELLAELGITEETVGAPIEASMEVVQLGRLADGPPVCMDRIAASSDAIVVVNRVKPHTDFHGSWESGVGKMIGIGLGKRKGADGVHRYGPNGLRDLLPQMARLAVEKAPIAMGIAVIENAYDEVADIIGLHPTEIAGPREAELLARARELMPSLPFDEIDVLIMDEMGKNVSGSGMDPNILGRMRVFDMPDLPRPRIRVVTVHDITRESHGNGTGIGLADVTTRRLVEKLDFEATYINGLTSGLGAIYRIVLPVVAPDDRSAVMTALRVCGRPDPQNARIVRIKNTLHIDEIDLSEPLLAGGFDRERLAPVGGPFALPFDADGRLRTFDETM
ncbi:MAG: nickel pincer cofactor-dependent isomerase, group 22 [Chloroflexota bacterium]